MNSKELLEQADKRIAELDRIKLVRVNIVDNGHLLNMLNDDTYELSLNDIITGAVTPISTMMDISMYNELKGDIKAILQEQSKAHVVELENLLGIHKPMTISFKEPLVSADQVTAKLTEILQDEAKKIEAPPEEKSMEKYPVKKDGRRKYPDNLKEEDIRRMYVGDGMTKKQIAEHYGMKESTINNYIFLHDITKKKRNVPKGEKPKTETEKQPDDKESHSQP